jgi:type I restriction enzyme S subunit
VNAGTPGWLAQTPATWHRMPAKAAFRERREPNLPHDVHLTPSQAFGVLPQAEYMARTGNAVVQNIQGQDSMKHVEPDDFIIHLRSFQGGIERSTYAGKVSTAYTVLEPSRLVVPDYFRWLLKSDGYVQELRTTTNQLRDGQSIKFRDFAKIPLPVPPPEEQRTIAAYLDRETARIDTLIEEQQRLIEMLRERRTAAIAARLEALGGMTRLKHVSTVQTGVTLSGEGDPADPEWPYLRVANVQVGYVDLREIKTVRVPPDRAAASMLQPGDVLMTEGGDIDKLGRGALWRGEVPNMLHQNHIFAVRPSDALDSEFLVDWLDGPVARTYFRTTAKQTTNLAGTNKWTLGNLPVPVPPRDEQRRVVDALDEQTTKIDALIEETERFIELARERRGALITAAVTGQIDVREMV